jgi:hypothetical protein
MMVISKPMLKIVNSATLNVKPVKILPIIVLNVPKTDKINQYVIVHKDISTMLSLYVHLAPTNVILVLMLLITVSFVLMD